MNNEGLKVEIKQNGAGRLYFVVRTPAGKSLLVSQSFEEREGLEDCLFCMKKALGKEEQLGADRDFPAYTVSMDSQGVNLLCLYPCDDTLYLLSGGHSKPEEFMLVLEEIKKRIGCMRVSEFSGR